MQIIRIAAIFWSLSLAGATGILGARKSLADEAPPETTTVRTGPHLYLHCAARV